MDELVKNQFEKHDILLKEIQKVNDSTLAISILKALNDYCLAVFKVNCARMDNIVDNIKHK